jgi:uncharacterized membrane protein
MRQLFTKVWLFIIVLLSTHIASAEVVRQFDSVVRLMPDTSLDVTENIQMDFEGAQRHGIYRTIPVRYDRNGGKYSIYLKVIEITDDKGNTHPYTTSSDWSELNIKIGDPDKYVSGVVTYRIHYTVRRAVNFFNNKPEVYWNATGNAWRFPIQNARAWFYAPPGVDLKNINSKSFFGPLGSTQEAKSERRNDHIVFYAQNLGMGEGLTFVAGLPAGSVTPPSFLQNLWWLFVDWWPIVVFPLCTMGFIFPRYLKTGRDENRGQAVGVEFNPPKNLSPAEVGTLVDEKCDMADVVSTVVDLAARGYLVIEELESQKFLFFSDKDYRFTRIHTHDNEKDTLLPHEQRFLSGLFGDNHFDDGNPSVTLSSLKNRFYSHLPAIQDSIYDQLTRKGLFTSNPKTTRDSYYVAGFVMLGIAFFAAVFGAAFGFVAVGLGLGIAGLIVLSFAKAMPAKTAAGSRALRDCLGFKRFVEMAEKERIRVLAKEDPTVFGRLLPYAMVLGVADQWADAFRDLLVEPPSWYVGSGYGHGFSSHIFVSDLGRGMNTMGSTFSSQPKSQGGSGGSGFSSGGGFSGGGFGGGGGGSW